MAAHAIAAVVTAGGSCVVKVLLFRGSGQVGVEIRRQGDVVWPRRVEADFSVPGSCAKAIRSVRPSVVINAAAYTAVERAESEVELAGSVNAIAPAEMARAACDLQIPFLHISDRLCV